MPNHVHLLILPLVPIPVLMRWLKGSTARKANQILGRTGHPFWQDESWDHYLRSPDQIERTTAYIEQDPVSAGLVSSPECWRWSSAGWQAWPQAQSTGGLILDKTDQCRFAPGHACPTKPRDSASVGRLKLVQIGNSFFHDRREPHHFLGRVTRSPERRLNLLR
jgi:hypothetical protein